MAEQPISFSAVRANRWTVIGDDVYDLGRFGARHPGGGQVAQLQGTDATLPMVNAHGVQGELGGKMPRKLVVGQIDEASLNPTDRDLRALWRSFKQRGLFQYRTRWLVVDAVRGVGLFAAALLATRVSMPLAFVVLTAALLNTMWWVHDACHDSVFADKSDAKRWGELASMIFVGTPVLDYQQVVHRIHHGFTNVIGADHALETGPVIWDERMRHRSAAGFIPFQALAWFLLVLPMTFPLFLVSALVTRAKKKDHLKLALTALRWIVAIVLFSDHLALLIVPTLAAGYLLALTSSLNHFHKPMSDSLDPCFGRSVLEVTQNLRHTGPIISWLTGGLNFHIEHHLFATMPRHNYRVIAPEIRAFALRHGLPYSTCTLGQAVGALWTKLRRPFGEELDAAAPGVAQ